MEHIFNYYFVLNINNIYLIDNYYYKHLYNVPDVYEYQSYIHKWDYI